MAHQKYFSSISLLRVDPNIKDTYSRESPMQIAAERDSVELLSLFNKYAMNPPSMTIKLLKLMIESDRSLDAFKKQLQSLTASEVISYHT